MAETLLIYYKPSQQSCYWALVNEQNKSVSQISHGELSDITAVARGKRTTVLIDSACVSIESVNIPGQSRQRQLQAIPFALEEQLASDIDDIHFAVGKKTSEQHMPVVSINKALLENTLKTFKQADIFIDILAADVLALPFTENNWTILINEDGALIKTDHANGYYCDLDNFPVIFSGLINKNNMPEAVDYFHKTDDNHAVDLMADSDVSLNINTYDHHPLDVFVKNPLNAYQINILQNEYAPKRQSTLAFKPWKSAAALFALWMVVQLISASIESQQLKEKNQALTSQIEKEFKRANPAARKFNNIRKRMERTLTQLQGGGNKNEQLFLQILSDAVPAFAKTAQVKIRGIVYRNKYIDMDLQADSLQSLEQVKNLLMANRKLKVVMSTSVEKNKTRGRLRLEAQG